MDVNSHAEELASDLGVDKEEVKADLENLLEYSVPIDEAKQSVRRKHGGGGGGSTPTPDAVDVGEITTDHDGVTVTVEVLTQGTRTIRYQGDDLTIREGEVADETGVISYTAWDELSVEAGDTVRVEGEVREWDGEPQVNIDSDADVIHADADIEPEREPYGVRSVAELKAGDRAVTVEVGVVDSEEKEINGRDGETTITSGTFGDPSGRLPFTDWENRSLDEGGSVRVENAYVNEYRGIPQVNMGGYTTVETSEDIDVSHTPPETDIAEAVEKGGDFDVVVRGNALTVKEGSGIVERCPDCGRVVQKGQCRVHGDVDAESDMRTKAVLDDGTGAVTLVVGRELTEELYGGSLEDAREEARDAMDKTVVTESIADNTVGRRWRVRGNVSVGDYGANMNVSEMEEADDDPADTAREVLDEF